jgi:hypothetical protein
VETSRRRFTRAVIGWLDNVAIYAVTVATRYFKDFPSGSFC